MNALVPPPARFSSAEFQRLLKAGAFGDMRVELREGKIVKMSPQYYKHGKVKRLLAEALEAAIKTAGLNLLVEQEISVSFSDGFEPLPDLIVWDPTSVSGEPDGPIPGAAVRLIVEVADTSLADDLGPKRADYAAAGLAEYWVADVNGRVLHSHTNATADGYAQQAQTVFGASVAGLTLPVLVETKALA